MKIHPSDYTIIVRPFADLSLAETEAVQAGIDEFMAVRAGQQRDKFSYHLLQADSHEFWMPLKSAVQDKAYFCVIRHDNRGMSAYPDSFAANLEAEIGVQPRTDLQALCSLVERAIQSQK
jgi:hypothetical protein